MPRTRNAFPHSYAEAAEVLGRRESRVIANNTRLVWHPSDGALAVRLHDTDVVTFYPGGLARLSSGGYLTRTTLDRISACLPAHVQSISGSCVTSRGCPRNFRPWVIRTGGMTIGFHDGMVV